MLDPKMIYNIITTSLRVCLSFQEASFLSNIN